MPKNKTKDSSPENSPTSNLDLMLAAFGQPSGASIAELVAVTGWQAHSVRGALAGTLKRKGHVIVSTKEDGVRRYRLANPA